MPVAIVVLLIFGREDLGLVVAALPPFLFLPLVGLTSIISAPLGEEFGWRGYLLPAVLTRLAPAPSALAVGFVWGVWHWPFWLFPDYFTGLTLPLEGVVHVISIVSLSVIMTWFHLHGRGSVWLAMVVHGVLNASVLGFEALAEDGALSTIVEWPFTLTLVICAGLVLALDRPTMAWTAASARTDAEGRAAPER